MTNSQTRNSVHAELSPEEERNDSSSVMSDDSLE